MQKTDIKYAVLFLSIAMSQLNASHQLVSEELKKNIYWPSQAVYILLSKETRPPSKWNETDLRRNLDSIGTHISNEAIRIENKNKGRFSSKTLEESMRTIKTFSRAFFKLMHENFIENIRKQSTRNAFKNAITRLENQREILAKEYFFIPDKRKSKNIALFLFDTLIRLYIEIYNKYYPNIERIRQ